MGTKKVSVPLTLLYNLLFVFIVWTLTSFLCHQYGKAFLELKTAKMATDHRFKYDWLNGVYAAFLLSCFQLALFYLSLDTKTIGASFRLLTSVTCHALATFCTNLSMAVTFASSTFAIKLTEPITSALFQFVIVGEPLSLASILSLPIICGGAIMFTGNPFCNPESSIGLGAALASNVFLSFRNVSFKQILEMEKEPKTFRHRCLGRQQQVLCVTMGLIGAICVSLLYEDIYRSIALVYLSGVFHVLYSYISMQYVLQKLTVVTHAITNIFKRIFVVFLLYMVGLRKASAENFLGLAVCTVGLFLYSWDKYDKSRRKAKNNRE